MSDDNPELWDRIARTEPVVNFRNGEDYLRRRIRPVLLKACNDGRLAIGPREVAQHVRIDRPSKVAGGSFDLVGGRRNFKRGSNLADLRTSDGGWLFFNAALRQGTKGLTVLAYDVERVFTDGYQPPWIRFDYNEPDHPNEARGLKAHFHPGNEDIQLPSPIFAPDELVELLLGDLGPRGGRKPRTKSQR